MTEFIDVWEQVDTYLNFLDNPTQRRSRSFFIGLTILIKHLRNTAYETTKLRDYQEYRDCQETWMKLLLPLRGGRVKYDVASELSNSLFGRTKPEALKRPYLRPNPRKWGSNKRPKRQPAQLRP
ncbi:hypothetical protein J6590_069049 [Homalodisca vitripennis]|nr:hypothetical protein J6590_069049 [Homalodisca vitripennis]